VRVCVCSKLQLLLNLLGTGCAGFRKLTPLRPVMLVINMALLARYWMSGSAAVHACCTAARTGHGTAGILKAGVAVVNSGRRRKIAVTAVCLTLMFSENMVRAWNDRGLGVNTISAQTPTAAAVAKSVQSLEAVVALDLHVGESSM
jgi:hypothetical protein